MIYKGPYTDTEVPWHQDQGYWLDMPDKRALSCWVSERWQRVLKLWQARCLALLVSPWKRGQANDRAPLAFLRLSFRPKVALDKAFEENGCMWFGTASIGKLTKNITALSTPQRPSLFTSSSRIPPLCNRSRKPPAAFAAAQTCGRWQPRSHVRLHRGAGRCRPLGGRLRHHAPRCNLAPHAGQFNSNAPPRLHSQLSAQGASDRDSWRPPPARRLPDMIEFVSSTSSGHD
jgi:hypothetical protein